ncbi:MAG: hypothetical protein Q4B10_00570 [Actinomycetaceae bacterium]|nr:hypothetical protein [Actinomycetaceae bacterium]
MVALASLVASSPLRQAGHPTQEFVGRPYADLGLADVDVLATKDVVITQELAPLVGVEKWAPASFDSLSWTIIAICGSERTVEDSEQLDVVITPSAHTGESFLQRVQSGELGLLTGNISCWAEDHPDEAARDELRWWTSRPVIKPIPQGLRPLEQAARWHD